MPGIRGRVFHVNVNCSDLKTAVAFYRDAIGLVASVRTTPRHPQPGQAFGLAAAQWDAWIMTGAAGLEEVVLDLLEWKTPRPSHPAGPGGFERLRVGVGPGSPLGREAGDPDGLPLEIVARDRPRVAGVVVGCSDLAASSAFYREVLALERSATSTFCDGRGPDVFSIELTPVSAARAPRVATDLGLYRLALLTDDLDRDYAVLTAAGVHPYSAPMRLDMGPGLPELRAVFFPDPDGTTFELIEEPAAPNPANPG